MGFLFYSGQKTHSHAGTPIPRLTILICLVIVGVFTFSGWLHAQNAGDPGAEFKRISAKLSEARLAGGDESPADMEKALAYLDYFAIAALNGSPEPNVEAANRALAGLVSHTPPLGENYRLVKLGGTSSVYAMAVNFGEGGPAAVRIYAGGSGHLALAARIDHFSQKDFFDSDLELVSVSNAEPVFVTISGRTDDLSTGVFSAWRFDGSRVTELWNSDLLQQSSYEADESGFRVAYCSHVNDDRPSECLKMSRDVYRFQGGEWKRIETSDLPAPKPVAN
jgi:hypothetical protein